MKVGSGRANFVGCRMAVIEVETDRAEEVESPRWVQFGSAAKGEMKNGERRSESWGHRRRRFFRDGGPVKEF